MMMEGHSSRGVIRSQFKQPLGQEDAFRIIEAGIKFFLFQRGQIPIPYEKLHSGTAITVVLKKEDEPGRLEEQQRKEDVESQDEDENEGSSTWNRIRTMNHVSRTNVSGLSFFSVDGICRLGIVPEKLERRAKLKEMRLTNKYKKLIQKEINIREVWDGIFSQLRCMFVPKTSIDVCSVVVIFGPTIYNAKETIKFQIDPSLITKGSVDHVELYQHSSNSKNNNFQTIMRGFYKEIIMSSQFIDFTDKPLRNTNCYICILTKQLIPDEAQKNKWILLENSIEGLRETINKFRTGSLTGGSPGISSKRKYLEVNLALTNTTAKLVPLKSENFDFGGVVDLDEGVSKVLENSGSICSVPNLFCYQLPVRYKCITKIKQ